MFVLIGKSEENEIQVLPFHPVHVQDGNLNVALVLHWNSEAVLNAHWKVPSGKGQKYSCSINCLLVFYDAWECRECRSSVTIIDHGLTAIENQSNVILFHSVECDRLLRGVLKQPLHTLERSHPPWAWFNLNARPWGPPESTVEGFSIFSRCIQIASGLLASTLSSIFHCLKM